MNSNQFHYFKAELESDGYTISSLPIRDWLDRNYIKNTPCPVCEQFNLRSIILRKKRSKLVFAHCSNCGQVSRISGTEPAR